MAAKNEVLAGQPVPPEDCALLEAYQTEIVKQVERMDALAKEFIKLELGIPGIYAVALRLLGESHPTVLAAPLAAAFGFWLAALICTLAALFPRERKVLRGTVRRVQAAPPSGRSALASPEELECTKSTLAFLALAGR